MKKIWLSILLCLLLAAGAACAEGKAPTAPEALIDMSGYTDEQLVLLMHQVQSEIAARQIAKTAHLRAGTYIGGRDIPVGRYILTGAGEEGSSGIMELMLLDETGELLQRELYEFVYSEECDFYIMVDEGEQLTLPFECDLTIYAGIQFE